MSLHAVCRADEVPLGQSKSVVAGAQKLLVYHLSDGYFATQANCTHVFAPLARGKIIDDKLVQCPFHRARFEIRTGAVATWANFPPGIQLLNVVRGEKALQRYPVKVVDGVLHVDVPA